MSNNQTNLPPEDICLSCGLCCNGVIFANGQLQPGDDAQKLLSLGLKFISRIAPGKQGNASSAPRVLKFAQPCAAFCQGRCRIYTDRPQYCRQFECLLLKRLQNGEVTREQALRTIRLTRRQADEVLRLLRALGDTDEHKPLATRLRQTTGRVENRELDKQTAVVYGQLTVAVQKLHCTLSSSFYPG